MSRVSPLLVAIVPLAGCVLHPSPPSPAESCGRPVDASRELEIVDDDTLARLSQNEDNGPLSFRRVAETLAGEVDSGTFTDAWMRALGPEVERQVRDAWAPAEPRQLARAPFRLIAVANRMDLAGRPAMGAHGEGRLVYALTRGSADDPSAAPLGVTLIVEYALDESRSAADWATAWHALGDLPLGSSAYDQALIGVVASFATRDALAQVRWNDAAAGLRQLELGHGGLFAPAPLRNTPLRAFDGSPGLVAFARTHADEIERDTHLLPGSFLATVTSVDGRPWNLPGVEEKVGDAFALGTCGGCHAHDAIDGAFHVSPLRRGAEKLSPMISQDLTRRRELFEQLLCDAGAR